MSLTPTQAIFNRRTIRNYDPNFQIPKEQLDIILKAAQSAPTACDMQGADFYVVRSKELLSKINEIVINGMDDGPMKEHFKARPKNHGVTNATTCDATTVILMAKNDHTLESFVLCDAGIQSMAIMIAAQEFGIESMCLGILICNKKVQGDIENLLGLKKDSLMLGVALGKKLPTATVKDKVIKSKIFYKD